VGTDDGEALAERFQGRPCLWHDGALWLACHAFRVKVSPYFGPRRATISVKGQARQAYQLLRLRERPGVEDFLEYLDGGQGEFGERAVWAAETPRLLTLYHRLAEAWGDDGADDRRFPLLAADGRLVRSDEVFFDDAPWYSERVRPGAIRLLHSG